MRKGVIFLGIILFLSFVSASFEIGNLDYLIGSQYSQSDKINGWVNLSFEEESADSVFEDSFGNSITLIDLLNGNLGVTYSCSPGDCLPSYVQSNEEQTKEFSLNSGEKKIIGFKITEDVASVDSVTFDIESDAAESCLNQLQIDFLDDGNIDAGNNKSSASSCFSDYGCFDSGQVTSVAKIDYEFYCQKINLSASPKFELGAWVKEETAGTTQLFMFLYDTSRNFIESCELPAISSSGGEVSCEVNHPVLTPTNYYVCISSSGGTGGEYYVRGYADSSGCGYKGSPDTASAENFAYQIFAKGKKFGAMGTLSISNVFSQAIENYLDTKYNKSCSSGCVVPIELISNIDQNLILKNLDVDYSIGGGLEGSTDKFYDISEEPSKISSGFQKINLDPGNFFVPSENGDATFELELDNQEIISEEITVKSAPLIQGLKPKITASAIPTEFTVLVNESNVDSYVWEFGDGVNATTSTNKAKHTYGAIGTYKLKVTVLDANSISSSKEFNVKVDSPKQAIQTTLKKKQNDLSDVDSQIRQSKFAQELRTALSFETLDSSLTKIEQDYLSASSEEDYKKIMMNLLEVEVPESVNIVLNANSITYSPQKSNINLDVVKRATGGNYDIQKSEEYSTAIILWTQEKINVKVTFTEFDASYGYFDERPILNAFEFNIENKNSNGSYLFISKMEGLNLEGEYALDEDENYFYK